MPNYVVVDLETSSLDPEKGSILSIGAKRRRSEDEFYGECRVWKGAEVDEKALAVNGFSLEDIYSEEKETESSLIKKFFEWAGDKALLIGMNPYFDFSFLRSAAQRASVKNPFNHRTIDMHTLAITFAIQRKIDVPEKGFYTDHIYRLLHMEIEPRPHNALTGARMEYEAFSKLFYSIVGK